MTQYVDCIHTAGAFARLSPSMRQFVISFPKGIVYLVRERSQAGQIHAALVLRQRFGYLFGHRSQTA